MKLKYFYGLMLTTMITMTSCSAKVSNLKGESNYSPAINSQITQTVGDSIFGIIDQAKKITAVSLPVQSDSIQNEVSKKISSKEVNLIRFIISDPDNYKSDQTVYGIFTPQFQVCLSHNKETVTIKYDFGLKKWAIYDANDIQLYQFDLQSNDMLRYAHMLFPENEFYNNLTTEKK